MSEFAAHAKAEYRQKALKNLDLPQALRAYEYEVLAVRSGEGVLAEESLSMREVLIEPRHLLMGDVYNGGSTVAMDPFHQTTPALVALRFADFTGNPHAIHSTIIRAANAIENHGVPPEIEAAHAVGTRAEEFSAMDVIAVMPDIADLTTWRERAQATHEMLGALVAVPGGNQARSAVHGYTSALSNPSVSLSWMQPYVDAVLQGLTDWGAHHERGGWGIHQ